MSLMDNGSNGMVMPVSPMYGGGQGGFGYGSYGDSLRTMNSNARFDASQNAQTAAIEAGQRLLANEVEQYVAPSPRPAYIVQNPNCCAPQTFGRGCAVA